MKKTVAIFLIHINLLSMSLFFFVCHTEVGNTTKFLLIESLYEIENKFNFFFMFD